MAQSHCQLWVHLIWTTKEREPWLKKEHRWNVIAHIRERGNSKKYHIDVVNGVEDHLHALVAYKGSHSVSRIVNDLKGESSNWINKNDVLKLTHLFRWQAGYGAFSVDPKAVPTVRKYILNQEKHHKRFTLDEELKKFGK
jgi:REP element-mobilizing transposase RayT